MSDHANSRPAVIDPIVRALPFVLGIGTVALFFVCHVRGDTLGLGHEDGPLEWGTVFFFAVGAGLCLAAGFIDAEFLTKPGKIFLVLFALVLLAAIGEELSWGQRIFGWDPPEVIARGRGSLIEAGHDDTALHNLSVRSKYVRFSIGGLLFGVVMLAAIGIHGIWLPLAHRDGNRHAKWLVDRLGLFVPPMALGILACGGATAIYIVRKIGTEVEGNEFIEFIVPMVYVFMLMRCYFGRGRRADRLVAGLVLVLVTGWLATTIWVVAASATGTGMPATAGG